MRFRSLFLSVPALVLGLLLAAPAAPAAAPEMPAGKLEIRGSKKSVLFGHEKHARKGVACDSCHHRVKDQEIRKSCSSAGCHDDREGRDGGRSLHRVMHGKDLKRGTCFTCHAEVAERKSDPRKKARMIGCSDSKCHR